MDLDPFLHELLEAFLIESREVSQQLRVSLLSIDQAEPGSAELAARLTEVARGVHTLKGNAATLELGELAALAYEMEERVNPFRKSLTPPPRALAEALLRGLEVFIAEVAARCSKAPGNPEAVAAATGALAALAPDAGSR